MANTDGGIGQDAGSPAMDALNAGPRANDRREVDQIPTQYAVLHI